MGILNYRTSVILLLVLVIVGCTATPSPQVGKLPIANAIGPDWECHPAPSEDKMAGFVWEVTEGGAEHFDGKFAGRATRIQHELGTMNYSTSSNVGGLLDMLGSTSGIPIGLNLDWEARKKKSQYSVAYQGVEKFALSGDAVREIESIYRTKRLKTTSRYVVIRGSISATSASISFEGNILDSIALEVGAGNVASLKSNLKNSADNSYTLNKEFKQSLGVCTIAYALDVKSKGGDGSQTVEVSRLPISLKKLVRDRKSASF